MIKNIDGFLIEFHIPDVFDIRSTKNALKRADETFQNILSGFEINGTTNTKDLMTFDFFARMKFYEKRYKDMKKAKN